MAVLFSCAFLFGFLDSAWTQAPSEMPVTVRVPPKLQMFGYDEVKLLPGRFLEVRASVGRYLLSIDIDRLLHTFRTNAGLPSTALPLGGWESPEVELRGHTAGHFMTACALMYASTADIRFKNVATSVVEELVKVQKSLEAHGSSPGYLSAFPEEFIDRVESNKRVWAPYYTLHKIMAGLLDVYTYCGNEAALKVVVGMADWVGVRMDRLTFEQQQRMLRTEFGGMNDVLSTLARVTGNPRYLRLARTFDHEAVYRPLALEIDSLDGLHGNTQIPKMIGAVQEYALTGEDKYWAIARFFWERVARERSFVIGGNTNDESFFPVSQFSYNMGSASTETCNSYNMLKLTRALFAHEPTVEYIDFYERVLYNHILASQDPSTGMMCYYVPLKPGAYRTYSKPDSSFWCCVGTGMENPARAGEVIYARSDGAMYVNLFIPSEVTWKEKGVVLRQETNFPEEARSTLMVSAASPVEFSLFIRSPGWAGEGISVAVNGQRLEKLGKNGTFVQLNRRWKSGDTIEIALPMALAMESMPDDSSVVAFLYGPVVLAGDLGTNGLGRISRYGPAAPEMRKVERIDIPEFVMSAGRDLFDHIKSSAEGPLAFRTVGLGRPHDVTLAPFYTFHDHRYTVYWKLRSREAWAQADSIRRAKRAWREEIERGTVDAVAVDAEGSEKGHAYRGERTADHWFDDRKGREARSGWFSYELAVKPGSLHTLVCTYRGSEGRDRRFEVIAEDSTLALESLGSHPPEFFEREYAIPAGLTQSRNRLRVIFRSIGDAIAGPLFEVRTVSHTGK